MNPKIVLLNPPGKRVYLRDGYCSHVSKAGYIWHPIDLVVQSGILSKVAKIYVIDAIASNLSEAKVINRIVQINPNLVLSLHGAVSNAEDLNFFSRIHDKIGVDLFLVGDKPLWNAEELLQRHDFIKGVLTDYKSSALAKYILSEASQEEKGIFWKDRSSLLGSGGFVNGSISFPIPKFELFPLNRYWIPHQRTKRFYSVMTSFGCPHHCSFCPYENIPFTRRNLENIIEELEYVESLNIRELLIKDECFGAFWEDTQEFLDYLINSRNNWCFSAEVSLDKLSKTQIETIARAGAHTLFFGVEISNTDFLREKYGKDINKEKLRQNIEICKSLKIKTAAHYMLGLPGEDYESVSSTIDFSLELDTDYAAYNIATPQPGTTFWENSLKDNLFDPNKDIDSSCTFPLISTSELSSDVLWKLYKTAFRKFYFRKKKIWNNLLQLRSRCELTGLVKTGIGMLRISG